MAVEVKVSVKDLADAKIILPSGEDMGPCHYPNRMLKPTQMTPDFEAEACPLLSDRSHEISRRYGVLREEMGLTFRATFIISPDGEIKYACLYPPEVGRNVGEIIRVIQALQFEEATGLGVPAGWQPGDPGIRRDFSAVGKI